MRAFRFSCSRAGVGEGTGVGEGRLVTWESPAAGGTAAGVTAGRLGAAPWPIFRAAANCAKLEAARTAEAAFAGRELETFAGIGEGAPPGLFDSASARFWDDRFSRRR